MIILHLRPAQYLPSMVLVLLSDQGTKNLTKFEAQFIKLLSCEPVDLGQQQSYSRSITAMHSVTIGKEQ